MVIAEAELGLCMMPVPMQQSKKIMKKLELNELNEKSKTDMQNVKTDRQLATGTMEWRRSFAFSFLFSAVATQQWRRSLLDPRHSRRTCRRRRTTIGRGLGFRSEEKRWRRKKAAALARYGGIPGDVRSAAKSCDPSRDPRFRRRGS